MDTDDVLHAITALPDPLHPSTQMARRAAAEIKKLRADADRYNWLRTRDLDTISQGGVFAGMTPENVILNEEDLDRAIDAAMNEQ